MGSASSVNCFDRWGRRSPDGPLIKAKSSITPSIASASTESGSAAASEVSASHLSKDATQNNQEAAAAGDTTARRKNRRRPTAMAAVSAAVASDTEAMSVDETASEDSGEEASVADTMNARVKALKKALTHVVRLKTNFFANSVKVTTNEDGSLLQWYPAKKEDTEGASAPKKKLGGSIPIQKVIKVQVSHANNKTVEVTAMNPGHETYSFTFKNQTSAQKWLDALKSLQKLNAMA